MTFFETQQQARKNTKKLVAYFVAAIIAIIIAIYSSFTLILMYSQSNSREKLVTSFWNPGFFLGVSVSVLALVLLGSLYKTWALRGGGPAIATRLGGRLLSSSTNDPVERKILNVVEEMSLASGVPVPPVYMMDNEQGINAFAAGYNPEDAVVGVTRGCVELLNRNELQGVIAHEFSHILNGDMRLNIRLIGLVHGILLLGLLGYWILRSGTGRHRVRSSNRDNKGGGIALFGLALLIVGYIGVFFGNLIKAAVSREREYLADASAVQFTRLPEGIGGALKKIGGLQYGSQVQSSASEEASHMFFANGLRESWFNLLATHPPLTKRIQKIDKHFDGVYPVIEPETVVLEQSTEQARPEKKKGPLSPILDHLPGASAAFAVSPESVVASIGNPGAEHLEYAQHLMQQIPEQVYENTHDPFGARAIVYCLLLDPHQAVRDKQISYLRQNEAPELLRLLSQLLKEEILQDDRYRLPLVDLSLPAIKQLSAKQYQEFKSHLSALVKADKEVSLFEFALHHTLIRNCERQGRRTNQMASDSDLKTAVRDLLWILAYSGHSNTQYRQSAFLQAWSRFSGDGNNSLQSPGSIPTLDDLDRAIDILTAASPELKRPLVEACVVSISTDNTVSVSEAEILRTICDALHCPIPPFVAGQSINP